MAVSFHTLTLCFFVLFVALAMSAKDSSKEDESNSASMESNSSSDKRSDTSFKRKTTTQSPAKPPTPFSTDAQPPISLTDFCQSNTNGNYINPNDCKTYIACSNGYAYVMPCPANLVYNKGGWCDYVQNVPRCM